MKALQIFKHAVRQIFGNFKEIMHIFAPFIVILLSFAIYIFTFIAPKLAEMAANAEKNIPPDMNELFFIFASFFISIIIIMLFLVAIIVNFHRFILLNENQRNFLPSIHTKPTLKYILSSLVIAISTIPFMLIFSFIGYASFAAIAILAIPLTFLMTIYIYRVSVKLPAAAINKPISLTYAFNATSGQTSTFLGLALLNMLASAGANIILSIIGKTIKTTNIQIVSNGMKITYSTISTLNATSIFAIVISVTISVLLSLVNLSVITTLYGHYVEKRPLV